MNLKKVSIVIIATMSMLTLSSCSRDGNDQTVGTTYNTYRQTTTTTEQYRSPNSVNLQPLYDAVPSLADINNDAKVMELLQITCDSLDENGGDFYSTGDDLIAASADTIFQFTPSDAGAILGAAVAIVCPRWLDEARNFANA